MTTTHLQQDAVRTLHAIETLQWNSRGMADREHAHAHQARLSAFLSGPALRTIERVFTQISPPGEVWRLDSLAIDIGPMREDGSFAQWSEALEHQLWNTLWRARHEQGGAQPAGVLSADDHALEHFLYYLQHGHLPWARSALAGRELSAWLARLARRTGAALWTRLRQLQPADYVEARLCQIAPCEGLQALLAVRHSELADSLDALDAQLLAPLQAMGRLSAYQVWQLRQRWRVAGFRVLWAEHAGSLGADALRRLQRELGLALARQLGRSGLGAWRPGKGEREGKEFGQRLLLGVLDVVASPSGQRGDAAEGADAMAPMHREAGEVSALSSSADPLPAPPDAEDGTPSARAETDWQRMRMALEGRHPLDISAFRALLRGLRLRDAEGVRVRLREEGLRHARPHAWFARLGGETVWEVMQVMADDARAVGARPSAAGASWAESLRQFALAALAGGEQPGGGRKADLSALQAWLAEYSLRERPLGARMPRDPRGWRQLRGRALAEWSGQTAPTVTPQGRQAREWHAAPMETSRIQRGLHDCIGADATEIREERDTAGKPWQAVERPRRSTDVRQAVRMPPLSLSAHEAASSAAGVRVVVHGPALHERYLRAMQALAAQSRAVPPSALLARWRARLHRFVEAQPNGLGVEHFAASRDAWRGELTGDDAPTAAYMAGVTNASPVSPPRILARWLAGAISLGSAAAWATLLSMPDRLRAELVPRLRRRAWRAHVARHWTTTRKLELLVLIDAAWGRERLTHWQPALESRQWLLRAIAACTARPAPADGVTIDQRQALWLWEVALQWAVEPGPQSAGTADATGEADLFARWLHRLGVQADMAGASGTPMSLPAATEAVRHALHARSIGPASRFVLAALPRAKDVVARGTGAVLTETMRMPQPQLDSPLAVAHRSQAGEGSGSENLHELRAIASPRCTLSPTAVEGRAGAGDGTSTAAPMQPATSARWFADALAAMLPDLPATERAILHERLYTQAVVGTTPAWCTLARRYAQALRQRQPMRFTSASAATRALANAWGPSGKIGRITLDTGIHRARPWLPATRSVRTHRADLSRVPARRLPGDAAPAQRQGWKAFAELAPLLSPATRLARILALPAQSSAPPAWTVRRQVAGWLADAALCEEWLAQTHPAERWPLLAMLFPADIATLRRSSRVLRAAHARLLPDLSTTARAESHWAFLAKYLLLSGLPVSAPLLARRYAMHLYREDRAANGTEGSTEGGTAAMSFEHWLAHLAQVLDASERAEPAIPGVDAAQAPATSRPRRTTMRLDVQALRQPPDAAEQWEASRIPELARARAVAQAVGHTASQAQSRPAHTLINSGKPSGETRARQTALPEPSSTGNAPDEAAQRMEPPELARADAPSGKPALRRMPPQTSPPAVPFGARATPPAPAPRSVPPDIASAGSHYIANAGVVLLANYTQRLFDMLNLRDGPQLRDAASQSRAVRCLAYLVDGHEESCEPEWVLPKLLCGMPLAQPLTDEPGLDEDTRALLDSLLQAVIAHWKALGRTSVAGLQEIFLRRDGRLQREAAQAGAHWRLVVRPGPFDMLLDRLPWSYATIKLPWMKEVLYVDWR